MEGQGTISTDRLTVCKVIGCRNSAVLSYIFSRVSVVCQHLAMVYALSGQSSS